ncbi:MAG: hypothetical protein E7497_02460 [Ruminococcus sp.]|nr:hypothetical protein [Ruminococcus sp.]
MKRFAKITCALISCIIMLSMCGITVSAAENYSQGYDKDESYLSGVIDDKDLFEDDPDTLEELNELVVETSEELELYICIYLNDTARGESSTEYFADEEYDRMFGEDTDGIFYYMDLSEQYSAYDYISTSGKGMLYFDDHIDDMFDEIFPYLPSSGETIYASEIELAIEQICGVISDYASKEPGFFDYEYDSYTGHYIYMKNGEVVVTPTAPPAILVKRGLISLAIGAVVAVICYFIVKHHYKFKPSCNPSVYVSREESRFTHKDDRFIRTYTTKTKIQSSSGGGRSGGRGGGSHGGGGRHR